VVCDARTVTATVEEDLRPKVVGENGTLCIHVEPAEVRCSEGLLRQVLWNLAENSTKYRRQEARLELSIQGRVTGRWYEFRVSDNGSGMTSDEIRHAFEPFFRGERARATVGTGIGLAIVKRVLEACGGTASIHSALGQGTTFLIKLQLAEKG